MFDFRRRLTCPECGARVPREATLCPACGHDLAVRKESEQCPACGARIRATEESCPICGASRHTANVPPRINAPTVAAAVLALAAFLGAIWLTRPWTDLAFPGKLVEAFAPTDTPNPTPTYTATSTPTRTPTFTATPTSAPSANPVPPTSTPMIVEPLVHVVAKGDNLGAIARKYGVEAESIARANKIGVDAILTIGQKLVIPGTTAPTPTQQLSPELPPFANATPLSPSTRLTAPATPSAGFAYPQPLLLGPTNGSVIVGARTRVVLNWTSAGILTESEWYLLRIWRSEEDTDPLRIWTKATSWRLPFELYPEGEISHNFLWQVTVVTRVSESDPGIAISPASEKYEFCWQ